MKSRALARDGAVTLQANTITNSVCSATPVPTATPTATPSAAPTAQVTAVPQGAVRTGDGSPSGNNSARALLVGALALAGAGGATVVAARRRRRLNP